MTPFQARRYYGKDLTIANGDISNDAIFSLARLLPLGAITVLYFFAIRELCENHEHTLHFKPI